MDAILSSHLNILCYCFSKSNPESRTYYNQSEFTIHCQQPVLDTRCNSIISEISLHNLFVFGRYELQCIYLYIADTPITKLVSLAEQLFA